jgi:hypothetical protein
MASTRFLMSARARVDVGAHHQLGADAAGTPSTAVERICSMPSTPSISSSIRTQTPFLDLLRRRAPVLDGHGDDVDLDVGKVRFWGSWAAR